MNETERKRQQNDPNHKQKREGSMDKNLEDSFPSSDPPSTIPNPGERDVKEQTD